jgi:hypothetical protein
MATIVKHQNTLTDQLNRETAVRDRVHKTGRISIYIGIFVLLGSLLFLFFSPWIWMTILGICLAGGSLLYGFKLVKRDFHQIEVLQDVLDTQIRVTGVLQQKLPESFDILQDVTIPYHNDEVHVDYIVVSAQGLLAIQLNHGNENARLGEVGSLQKSAYHARVIVNMMDKYSDIPQSIEDKLRTQTAVVFTEPGARMTMKVKDNHYVMHEEELGHFLEIYQNRYPLLVADEVRYLTRFLLSLHNRGEQSIKDLKISYQGSDPRHEVKL